MKKVERYSDEALYAGKKYLLIYINLLLGNLATDIQTFLLALGLKPPNNGNLFKIKVFYINIFLSILFL